MEVLICAQWELEALAETPFDSPTALISIGDPGTPPPVLRHRTQHILRLEFDDARAPDAGQALTPAQAEQIAAFVYTHKDANWPVRVRLLPQRRRGRGGEGALHP